MGGLFHSKVRLCPLGYVYVLTVASVKHKNCFLFLFFSFFKISETYVNMKRVVRLSFICFLLFIHFFIFLIFHKNTGDNILPKKSCIAFNASVRFPILIFKRIKIFLSDFKVVWGSFKSHLTCWKSYPLSFVFSLFFFLIIREPGIPKGFALCTLLGGGELEGWKGCTFLSDGIRFPINGVGEERGGLGKNPSFSKLK